MFRLFKEKRVLILLLVILAIASFFRLWQLDLIPPGLYPDEAINGNDAISALKTGNFKVFYPENNGREGLFINLISLSFGIFGISVWSLKIVGALLGIFTVLGLFLLTRELFNKNIALLSSFFLAVSFWHVNFSRIGFRGIFVPFILVFVFYFLFRGFRTKRIWNFIISGVFFGLGFHTYISFRLSVLILFVVLLSWLFVYLKEKQTRKFLLFTACCLLFTFIVALPIGIYFLQNSGDFIGRATGVSIFNAQNPIKALGESLILHLGMFNFYGDSNWRHNFAPSPQLLWPVGILFLIGFIASIREFILSIKKRRGSLFIVNCLLLSWFFIMLLPGILTSEGIPHALRVIGTIPAVYIFAGLGGWHIYNWFYRNVSRKKLLVFTSIFVLFTIAFLQLDKYFIKWSSLPETKGAFSRNYVDIGNYLNSLSLETQKYVIVNQGGVPVPYSDGIPMPAQTIMFIESTKFNHPQSTYLLPENINQIKINDRRTVIVPMNYDQKIFSKLEFMFPQGKIQKKDELWMYFIK